ncbi:MAG: anti-sigma factor [Acidimicrobiia bacterium]
MTPWSMLRNGSCRSTRKRMSDHLDGGLSAMDEARFSRHLAGCRRCTQVLAALRSTIDELKVLARDSPPPQPSVVDDVINRIASNGGRA